MSGDEEDGPEGAIPIDELIASDDLHQVRKKGWRLPISDAPGGLEDALRTAFARHNEDYNRDALSELTEYAEELKAQLLANDWPKWNAWVENTGAGPTEWRAIESIQTGKDADVVERMTGAAYIQFHAPRLSDDWFRYKICSTIQKILSEKSESRRLFFAIQLGELLIHWKTRSLVKPVRIGRASLEGGKRGAEGGKVKTRQKEKRQRAWFNFLNEKAKDQKWSNLREKAKLLKARRQFARCISADEDLTELFKGITDGWFDATFDDWLTQMTENNS